MEKYKTIEELKEELGDEFDDFMYKSNIELIRKLDIADDFIETYTNERDTYKRLAETYIKKYNQEQEKNNSNEYLVKMSDYEKLEKELNNKEFLLLSQGKELKELWKIINEIDKYINSCDYISKAVLDEILKGELNE